ncbi:MAG: hypothetical protein WC748_07010 [Legionellales bacterium]|jgi:hypothetical protein
MMATNKQKRQLLKAKIYRLINVYDNPELKAKLLAKNNLVNRAWLGLAEGELYPRNTKEIRDRIGFLIEQYVNQTNFNEHQKAEKPMVVEFSFLATLFKLLKWNDNDRIEEKWRFYLAAKSSGGWPGLSRSPNEIESRFNGLKRLDFFIDTLVYAEAISAAKDIVVQNPQIYKDDSSALTRLAEFVYEKIVLQGEPDPEQLRHITLALRAKIEDKAMAVVTEADKLLGNGSIFPKFIIRTYGESKAAPLTATQILANLEGDLVDKQSVPPKTYKKEMEDYKLIVGRGIDDKGNLFLRFRYKNPDDGREIPIEDLDNVDELKDVIRGILNRMASREYLALGQEYSLLKEMDTLSSTHMATIPVIEQLASKDLQTFSDMEAENAQLRQALAVAQAQILAERAQHTQERAQLTAQLAQTTNELAASQAQQLAAKELIENSQQALEQQITLNETRSQEIVATTASVSILEQRLAVSEKLIRDKTVELDQLKQRIQTLQQSTVSSLDLIQLQTQAQQLQNEKRQLEHENQQLSAQCSSLKSRLKVLENEGKDSEDLQQTHGRDLTQLQTALQEAQAELGKREFEWQNKFHQEQKAKDGLKQAKAAVEHQAQLLEIHLNQFKKHGLMPKERAFQNFLSDIKRMMQNSFHHPLACYISYAWEDDTTDVGKAANLELQSFLLRLERDLKTLGVKVFLDVVSMTGNITSCMMDNIAKSNYFLLIGSERLKLRAQDDKTNVGKEWAAIEKRMQQNSNSVIPLLYQGEFATAFPPGINQNLIRDCKKADNYYDFMAKMISPMSFIRALLGIHLNGRNESLQDGYQLLWDNLETKFVNIELELSNETLRITQSVPSYAGPTVSSSNHLSGGSASTTKGVHDRWKGKASIKNNIAGMSGYVQPSKKFG